MKLGSTKTSWQNFHSIVTAIDRPLDHLMSYIGAELGAATSLGPDINLIL